MAATTRDQANMAPCTPEGYEYNDRTYRETPLLEDVVVGDELKLVSTGWRKRQAGERADGVALKKGKAGMVGFSIGVVGEMSGYVGLTPGLPLYPSAAINGALDTTPIAGFTPQVRVIRPGRIRFNYMS